MRVAYAVTQKPQLASYRLRVCIPAPHTGYPYQIGSFGGPLTFFYKLGSPEIARVCDGVVFDVVNDHFARYPSVAEMCAIADRITVGSYVMAETVFRQTGKEAIVIDDPYENEEGDAQVVGDRVLWFGHSVNLPGLSKLAPKLKGFRMTICTDYEHPSFVLWSPASEKAFLDAAAVVVLSGTNPGASSNRPAKAIRAGRYVVMPEDCAESWKQFSPYAWIGDVKEGIRWALNNREEACSQIKAGQRYIQQRFSPQSIGSQWGDVFGLILGAETRSSPAGSGSISP